MTATHTAVVIPALNEAATIGRVVDGVRTALEAPQVIVVDDGSTDATAARAAELGADVLQLPFNLGVGGAVRTGLVRAVRSGAERVVIMDADDQHDAADVIDLLAAVDAGAGLAVGSRFARSDDADRATPDYRMGFVRRRAQGLLNGVVSRRVGVTITDATSGFRSMNGEVAALLARDYPVEYLADTVEVLFLVRQAGYSVAEVPVRMRPRTEGRSSSRGLRLVVQYLRVLVGIAGSSVVRRRGVSS